MPFPRPALPGCRIFYAPDYSRLLSRIKASATDDAIAQAFRAATFDGGVKASLRLSETVQDRGV